MKKNIIVVTGGAGFVGSNLIELLSQKTNYQIISVDNYSTGLKSNHISNKKVLYLNGDTANFSKLLKKKEKELKLFFILENFLEFIKVFLGLIIVLIAIL